VAVEGLRGELGWWRIKDHMAMACLKYARRQDFIQGQDWASEVFRETGNIPDARKSLLQRRVEEWAGEYGVNLQEPVGCKRQWKQYVKRQVQQKVQRDWQVGMEGKSSLWLYRGERRMGMGEYWDGSRGAMMVFKARVGDLALGRREYTGRGKKECQVCREGVEEDLPHFLLECVAYREEREAWRPGGIGLGRKERTAWLIGIGRGNIGEGQWEALRRFLTQAWARRMRSKAAGTEVG
jgi:hypothetical protein